MNELEFIQQLHTWKIDVKSTMVPTTAEHKLYGHLDKTRIIAAENDYLIYSYVKPLEVTESMYKRLSEEAKLNDLQILKTVQDTYIAYLKDIRKKIISLQREWSKNYCQFRATQVINELDYEDIYHICDLAHERIIPIEVILKVLFNVETKYGQYRRIKRHDEIQMDSRVLKTFNDIKEHNSRTTVHSKQS